MSIHSKAIKRQKITKEDKEYQYKAKEDNKKQVKRMRFKDK